MDLSVFANKLFKSIEPNHDYGPIWFPVIDNLRTGWPCQDRQCYDDYSLVTTRLILWNATRNVTGPNSVSTTQKINFLKWTLNPKKTGGGGGPKRPPPPSTFRAITLQRAKLSPRHFMTFFFQVSRTFWHQICDARGYGSEVT